MSFPDDQGLLPAEQLGAVRLLTINRPDKLNAFNPALVRVLHAALDDALDDAATSMVVITGAGDKAFVVGNDIEVLAGLDVVGAYRDMAAGQQLFLRLHEFPKPTLAMVNGYALGGGFELALACDFIIASERAEFGFPEITLDTMPGWGGTQLAVKKMGLSRAKQMVLTGRRHGAHECMSYGFIQQVVEPHELRARTLAFCDSITCNSGLAAEMAKRSLNRAIDLPLAVGMELEAANYSVNFSSPRARAGLEDFIERRRIRSARHAAANVANGASQQVKP